MGRYLCGAATLALLVLLAVGAALRRHPAFAPSFPPFPAPFPPSFAFGEPGAFAGPAFAPASFAGPPLPPPFPPSFAFGPAFAPASFGAPLPPPAGGVFGDPGADFGEGGALPLGESPPLPQS